MAAGLSLLAATMATMAAVVPAVVPAAVPAAVPAVAVVPAAMSASGGRALDSGVPVLVHRSGWIETIVRDSVLASQWRERPGLERAYCVTGWSVMGGLSFARVRGQVVIVADTDFTIGSIVSATNQDQHPAAVRYFCPRGEPTIHIHPPHTCRDWGDVRTCSYGGDMAFQCEPSTTDLISMMEGGQPFDVVQCGAHQFRFYFPSDASVQRMALAPLGAARGPPAH